MNDLMTACTQQHDFDISDLPREGAVHFHGRRNGFIPSEPTTNLVNAEDDVHGYHALGYILLGVAAGYVIGGLSVVLVLVASAVI